VPLNGRDGGRSPWHVRHLPPEPPPAARRPARGRSGRHRAPAARRRERRGGARVRARDPRPPPRPSASTRLASSRTRTSTSRRSSRSAPRPPVRVSWARRSRPSTASTRAATATPPSDPTPAVAQHTTGTKPSPVHRGVRASVPRSTAIGRNKGTSAWKWPRSRAIPGDSRTEKTPALAGVSVRGERGDSNPRPPGPQPCANTGVGLVAARRILKCSKRWRTLAAAARHRSLGTRSSKSSISDQNSRRLIMN
jgi:hypothetical protein